MIALIVIVLVSTNERPRYLPSILMDRLLMDGMTPVVIEPGDSPVRKLQKERFNTHLEAVQRIWSVILINVWSTGPSRERQLLQTLPELAGERAVLEANPAD